MNQTLKAQGALCLMKGRTVGGSCIKIISQQLRLHDTPSPNGKNIYKTTQSITKTSVLTALGNLQRRSKDELCSENKPHGLLWQNYILQRLAVGDLSGRTTVSGILHKSGLNGQRGATPEKMHASAVA